MRSIRVSIRDYPLTAPFRIARGIKTHAACLCVEIRETAAFGRGLATPYARFGEDLSQSLRAAQAAATWFEARGDRSDVQEAFPPGALRNAFDLAFWDLGARRSGEPVHQAAHLPQPKILDTFHTLGVADASEVADRARAMGERPIKLKLAGDGMDADRIKELRRGAPANRLILDANEGLDEASLAALVPVAVEARAELIEQPTPPNLDAALERYDGPIPLCADESVRNIDDMNMLSRAYGAVNIKLDKSGGLTAALDMMAMARARGLTTMVGCMVAPSLAIAPAALLATRADFVDLDGPFLVAEDDEPSLARADGRLAAPTAELWG